MLCVQRCLEHRSAGVSYVWRPCTPRWRAQGTADGFRLKYPLRKPRGTVLVSDLEAGAKGFHLMKYPDVLPLGDFELENNGRLRFDGNQT